MIETKHLQLIPTQRAHLEALSHGKHQLAEILGVKLPKHWPHFPEALAPSASKTGPTDWPGYFFVHPKEGVLVGNGGFKGGPDASGTVEIGYEIATEYWNRGFATEAAQGMVAYAFTHLQVQVVIAHTLAQANASTSVLQKLGMRFVVEIDHAKEGKVWKWRIDREEHHPQGDPS